MSFNEFWNGLAATSYYAAAAPLFLSVITHFKSFVLTENELRNRCQSHRENVKERVNQCFFRIVDRLERSLTAIEIRGSPPNEPDLVADYTVETLRVVYVHRLLASIEVTSHRVHTMLLISFVGGLSCLLVAFPSAQLRPYAAIAAYIILAVQIAAILRARHAQRLLIELEYAT